MSATRTPAERVKSGIRCLLPLTARKRLAIWLHRQRWLGPNRSSWWAQELVRDLADKNINEYHKFLWSHHLSYAAPYEVASRFGEEKMKESRRLFFADLKSHLAALSVDCESQVRSAFEVGSSLGFQLRYVETDVFPAAVELAGIDIDAHAIHSGTGYLRRIGSNVRLECADMEKLDQALGTKRYDVMLCSGVLMYLSEDSAARLIDSMLKHTGIMLACAGLAHPEKDNSALEHSETRKRDHTFIHNLDLMISNAGGQIVARRWEGARLVDGQTIYFVFAGPRGSLQQRSCAS